MVRGRQQLNVPHIYEDPDSARRDGHKRTTSVGDMLRGRKKDTSPLKGEKPTRDVYQSPSPLGERHINSPPQPARTPMRQEGHRPPMHKKTGSAVSLKEMILGKDEPETSEGISSTKPSVQKSPKKTKSSTNLVGLLKKKSKRDLQEVTDNKKDVCHSKAQGRTALWEQFATQPLQGADGSVFQPQPRTVEEEIALYTPKDYSEYRPYEQRNFGGFSRSPLTYEPPRRPFLDHKSSRSSIFTENMNDENDPAPQRPKSRERVDNHPGSSRVAEIRSKFDHQPVPDQAPDLKEKGASRILDAISTFTLKSKDAVLSTPSAEQFISSHDLELAFEKVLDARNIPHNMRDTMRNLKPELKLALMRGDRNGAETSTRSTVLNDVRSSARSPTKGQERPKSQDGEGKRARSRSRPRSGILSLSKRDDRREDKSPTKSEKGSTRSRSKSRPKSVDLSSMRPVSARSIASSGSTTSLSTPDSAATPGDFIHYLQEVQKPSLIEVGKLHKLRILLRNESVSWTDHFVRKGGMDELVSLLYRITKIEWREEHEDNLLHETLLCLKGLTTTQLAMQRFSDIQDEFFPTILSMLFDPERKGPSDFSTRGVIISLLYAHLCSAQQAGPDELEARARKVTGFLQDPEPGDSKEPLEFVKQMHISRPYKVWCKEVVNVTKEVFWIFLHHLNVVPVVESSNAELTYAQAHFPVPRPPHPAAPYVGGVEWEATQYLAIHLDLLNGLIASMPTRFQRNQLREDLKQSGWEKVMGGSLRTCKEKFYGGVHNGLRVWVGAGKVDDWSVEDVRAGPPREAVSPRKSPVKGKVEAAPKISLEVEEDGLAKIDDAWV